VDKGWKKFCQIFIHRESTGGEHITVDVLVGKVIFKFLILLVFIKLCTAKVALNNNNNISISNIY